MEFIITSCLYEDFCKKSNLKNDRVISPIFYQRFIKFHVENNQFDKLTELWREMKENALVPTISSWVYLIEYYMEKNKISTSYKLFTSLKNDNFLIHSIPIKNILKFYVSNKRFVMAKQLYQFALDENILDSSKPIKFFTKVTDFIDPQSSILSVIRDAEPSEGKFYNDKLDWINRLLTTRV